jgi:hypothetical protein
MAGPAKASRFGHTHIENGAGQLWHQPVALG